MGAEDTGIMDWNQYWTSLKDQQKNIRKQELLHYLELDAEEFATTLMEILESNPEVMKKLQRKLEEATIKADVREVIEEGSDV